MKNAIVIIIIALLAGTGLYLFLAAKDDVVLENPRSLVPESVSIYAELNSLYSAQKMKSAVPNTGMTGMIAAQFFASNYPLTHKILSDPGKYGVSADRPIAMGARFPETGDPVVVSFIPISSAEKTAEVLGKPLASLKTEPAPFEKQHVLLKNGYLLVAPEKQILVDLVSAKNGGIEIRDPSGSSDLIVQLNSELISGIAKGLASYSGGAPGMSQLGGLFTQSTLKEMNELSLRVKYNETGATSLDIVVEAQFIKDGQILDLFKTNLAAPPLLNVLPDYALVGAVSVEPVAVLAYSRKMFDDFSSIINDSGAREIIELSSSMTAIQTGFARADVDATGENPNSLTVQLIPSASRDSYLTSMFKTQEKATKLWRRMMEASGHPGARMDVRRLPVETYKDIKINGIEVTTVLDMELPPNISSKMKAQFEKMRKQVHTTRNAFIDANVSGSELATMSYLINVTSDDKSLVREQISRILDERNSSSSVASSKNPGLQFEKDHFGYVFLRLADDKPFPPNAPTSQPIETAPPEVAKVATDPIKVFLGKEASYITAEISIPRNALNNVSL